MNWLWMLLGRRALEERDDAFIAILTLDEAKTAEHLCRENEAEPSLLLPMDTRRSDSIILI